MLVKSLPQILESKKKEHCAKQKPVVKYKIRLCMNNRPYLHSYKKTA